MNSNNNIINLYEYALHNHHDDYAKIYKDYIIQHNITLPDYIKTREKVAEFHNMLRNYTRNSNIHEEFKSEKKIRLIEAFEDLVNNIYEIYY